MPRQTGIGDDEPFDPSVDILVGLVAIILLSTILILPFVDFNRERSAALETITSEIRTSQSLSHEGKPVFQMVANEAGLTIVDPEKKHFVDVNALLDDPYLAARLQTALEKDHHPLLFIEGDGQEAAFLVETLLSKFGFTSFSRVYLDGSCAFLKEERKPDACRLSRARP